MNEKSDKKSRTQLIAADIEALQRQLAANQADIERVEKHKARLIEQQEALIEKFRNDPKAETQLEDLEEQEGKLEREKRRYLKEADKLNKRIRKVQAGLKYAEDLEAVERVLDERGPFIQSRMERLDVLFEEAAKIIDDELIPAGRANMDDVNRIHPQHADTRRFNPAWHIVDALNWRFHSLYPKNALPDRAFRRPLAELWRESLKAGKFSLDRDLKRDPQSGEDKSDEREVA